MRLEGRGLAELTPSAYRPRTVTRGRQCAIVEDVEAKASRKRRVGATLLGIGGGVAVLDQLTKIWAVAALEEGRGVPVLGETVQLLLIRNPGAAFSFATDATPLLSLLATAVVIGLVWYSRKVEEPWWGTGLGLVLGGAAGNLVDRLVRAPGFLHGHVVDFVSVGWWPIFNVADSALTVGVVVIAVAVLLGKDPQPSKAAEKAVTSKAAEGAGDE